MAIKYDSLNQFIGQKKIKEVLKLSIEGSKLRHKNVDHILLYAQPGQGKTTLANIIAKEMNSDIICVTAATLKDQSDIVNILVKLKDNDILFIDEIQSLDHNLEEILYSSIEEFKLRFIYSNEENSKPIEVDLNHFTLVAATTRISRLSNALLTRFPIRLEFEPYTENDIINIISKNLDEIGINIDLNLIKHIANYARKTPRLAINLTSRIADKYFVNNCQKINKKEITEVLTNLNLYEYGLYDSDIKILKSLHYTYFDKPVSLEAISNVTNIPKNDIEILNEPYLVEINFIARTKRGRIITKEGIEYLKNHNFKK